MEKILQYVLQVNVYALALLLVYRLLLCNQNAFRWSRIYLGASLILPFVLPFLSWPEFIRSSAAYQENVSFTLPEVLATSNRANATALSGINMIIIIYGIIAAFFLFRFVAPLLRFYKLVRHTGFEREGKYKMVYSPETAPGSFLQYILLPSKDIAADIILHEKAHVDLKHAYDMLIAGFIQCFGFFNLALPLVRRELLLVHEFHADRRAASDKETYAGLLLQQGLKALSVPTYHSFFTHPIKRRIMMLHNTSVTSRIRKAGVALLFSGLCILGITLQSKARAKETPAAVEDKDPVYRTVEDIPRAGYDWNDYMVKNVKFPEAAIGKEINCRVYVQFIIEKDGKPSNASIMAFSNKEGVVPEELRHAFEAAAVKVVSDMPAWQPGKQNGKAVRCYFTVPISFKSK